MKDTTQQQFAERLLVPRQFPTQSLNRGKAALVIGFVLTLTLFVYVVNNAVSDQLLIIDRPDMLLHLHGYAAPFLDHFAVGVSMLVTVVSLSIWGYLIYRRWWRHAIFWIVANGGGALLSGVVKHLVHRHRPALWDVVSKQASFGFPSGHAMHSMSIIVALWVLFGTACLRPALVATGVGFVLLVGVCRMYLGLHYPSDILGGWALATAWVCLLGILCGNFNAAHPDELS